MLFLTDVDHVSFEKANETRQNNLQSATVSLQVVIGLCKRKETAALKSKPPFQMGVSNCLLYDGFFSVAVVQQIIVLFFTYMLYGKFVEFIKIRKNNERYRSIAL